MGTRSLSCRFTPQTPTSPRRSTNAAGPIDSLTASPKGSRPRFVDRLPHPRPNASQNCSPISRAFFGLHDLDFFPINIGLDLPPQPRTRSPATQTDVIHRYTHLAEESKTVAQAEGYTFKNR